MGLNIHTCTECGLIFYTTDKEKGYYFGDMLCDSCLLLGEEEHKKEVADDMLFEEQRYIK